jgi:ribonuclease BN (tRNA processing enzyme)
LCLEDAQSRLFYSGDGIPTAATQALAEGCDLIIHESFQLDRTVPGHGSVRDSIELARAARAGALAMVHLQRDFRRDEYRQVLDLIGQFPEMEICLPEPGHEVWLGPGR